MGLFNRDKPKINPDNPKKEGFSGWIKCTQCHELIHTKELGDNLNCCPKCNWHYRTTVGERIAQLTDAGTFQEMFQEVQPFDALGFVDSEPYPKRLADAKAKSGSDESITVGTAKMGGIKTGLAIMNFNFMGGSMGSVMGERICCLIEYCIAQRLPLIILSASGGARMQESVLSLMQMAKTSAGLARLAEAKLPYISVLTNPTTGGVTASFASLGDVIVAEPGALICFAGPRVIEQTIKQKLPEGAQKSEFLVDHGMVDTIASRQELKEVLVKLLNYLYTSFHGA